jgi:hypothetical protein
MYAISKKVILVASFLWIFLGFSAGMANACVYLDPTASIYCSHNTVTVGNTLGFSGWGCDNDIYGDPPAITSRWWTVSSGAVVVVGGDSSATVRFGQTMQNAWVKYYVRDNEGATNWARHYVEVVNDPPICSGESVKHMNEDTSIVGNIDIDDPDGHDITNYGYHVTAPEGQEGAFHDISIYYYGSFAIFHYKFTPPQDYPYAESEGENDFKITVWGKDEYGGSGEGVSGAEITVSMHVYQVNDPPIIITDNLHYKIFKKQKTLFWTKVEDIEDSAADMTIVPINEFNYGSLEQVEDSNLHFKYTNNSFDSRTQGEDILVYKINDGHDGDVGAKDSEKEGQVKFTIKNRPPVAGSLNPCRDGLCGGIRDIWEEREDLYVAVVNTEVTTSEYTGGQYVLGIQTFLSDNQPVTFHVYTHPPIGKWEVYGSFMLYTVLESEIVYGQPMATTGIVRDPEGGEHEFFIILAFQSEKVVDVIVNNMLIITDVVDDHRNYTHVTVDTQRTLWLYGHDPDADTITFSFSQPDRGYITFGSPPSGSAESGYMYELIYTAPGTPGPDSFTYWVTDDEDEQSNKMTVLITVDDDEVTADLFAMSASMNIMEDSSKDDPGNTIVLVGGDMEDTGLHDLVYYISDMNRPTKGTLFCSGPGNRIVQYEPNPDENGEDSFQFWVRRSDGTGSCKHATISITIENVFDPPQAVDDYFIAYYLDKPRL